MTHSSTLALPNHMEALRQEGLRMGQSAHGVSRTRLAARWLAWDERWLEALTVHDYPLPNRERLVCRYRTVPKRSDRPEALQCAVHHFVSNHPVRLQLSFWPNGEVGSFDGRVWMTHRLPTSERMERRWLSVLHELGHVRLAQEDLPFAPSDPHPLTDFLNTWVVGPVWDHWWNQWFHEAVADAYAVLIAMHATQGAPRLRSAVQRMVQERTQTRRRNQAELKLYQCIGPDDSPYHTDGVLARVLADQAHWLADRPSSLFAHACRHASDGLLEALGLIDLKTAQDPSLMRWGRLRLLDEVEQVRRRDLGLHWFGPWRMGQWHRQIQQAFMHRHPQHPISGVCTHTWWGQPIQFDQLRARAHEATRQVSAHPAWALDGRRWTMWPLEYSQARLNQSWAAHVQRTQAILSPRAASQTSHLLAEHPGSPFHLP